MAKHTPGPWIQHTNSVTIRNQISSTTFEVGTIPDGSTGQFDTACANARLIAAAPELLEALEKLFADYKMLADSGDAGFWSLENLPVGQLALVAIAKAKGELK